MSVDSAVLRRWAYRGARFGPTAFVKHSPGLIGASFALGLPSMRARVRENLRRVMGRRAWLIEEYDVTRTFMNYAACLAEGLGFDRPEGRAACFRVEGGERLDAVLEEGRGAILLTAHVGPFEAAARFFAQTYRRELMVVMHRETNAEAREFHDELRRKMGILVVHVGQHALDALPVLTHLTSGGAVAMQLDRTPERSRDVEAKLFGTSWRMPVGPLRLAAICGAPVMTVFARRCGFFDYEVVIGEPFRVARKDLEHGLSGFAQLLCADMERAILRDPTQWFHFADEIPERS